MTEAGQKDQQSENQNIVNNKIGKTIAIAGGKGGTGKTFITSLLAGLLNSKGCRVGILDADFTASCVPAFFGVSGPVSRGDYSFIPPQSSGGVKIISADFFLSGADQKIVWKESLISNVVKELWHEMEWGELDYLLVDLPPANSEAAVTILQTIPIFGVLLVGTPHKASADINAGTLKLIQRLNLPLLGLVENGSSPSSSGWFADLAAEAQAPLLARVPFEEKIARACDAGEIEKIPLDGFTSLLTAFLDSVSIAEANMTVTAPSSEVALVGHDEKAQAKSASMAESDDFSHNEGCAAQPFSDTVMYLIQSRQNVGTLDQPDAQGLFTGSCGDRMQIDLRILADRILDARFLADGCGATYACGTMITKMATTKKLTEAQQINAEELLEALGGLPEDHLHCAELAVMTLREAIIDAVEGHRSRSAS